MILFSKPSHALLRKIIKSLVLIINQFDLQELANQIILDIRMEKLQVVNNRDTTLFVFTDVPGDIDVTLHQLDIRFIVDFDQKTLMRVFSQNVTLVPAVKDRACIGAESFPTNRIIIQGRDHKDRQTLLLTSIEDTLCGSKCVSHYPDVFRH